MYGGHQILVLEDEFLFADEIALSLARLGVRTIGPAPTVERALYLIEHSDQVDGAVVDINLRGDMGFPVADALSGRPVYFRKSSSHNAIETSFCLGNHSTQMKLRTPCSIGSSTRTSAGTCRTLWGLRFGSLNATISSARQIDARQRAP
jgi:hypothetical protein